MPGINVGPECYSWLALKLAEAGYIAVTYQVIAEEMPGYISLTPGLRLDRLGPEGFGNGPSATAIQPILEELSKLNTGPGPLQSALDLNRVILGGHSAGGTMALLNASPEWFTGVCGAFSYAAHTGAATQLGHSPGAILQVPGGQPCLLMGGSNDGVIAASGGRYGKDGVSSTDRIEATLDKGLSDNANHHLVIFDGANHFTFAHPTDGTTGRSFLEGEETYSGEAYRQLISRLVIVFANSLCDREPSSIASLLEQSPELVSHHRVKSAG